MSSTLSNLIYHIVFSTKNWQLFITGYKEELHSYIGGIIKKEEGIPIVINGMKDHIHIIMKLKPRHTLSEVMQKIKGNSSKWINENKKCKYHFNWQTGYGAYTVSESQLPALVKYVKNQEEHHKKKTFQEEYVAFIEKNKI